MNSSGAGCVFHSTLREGSSLGVPKRARVNSRNQIHNVVRISKVN
jgi:hypothetical protein